MKVFKLQLSAIVLRTGLSENKKCGSFSGYYDYCMQA